MHARLKKYTVGGPHSLHADRYFIKVVPDPLSPAPVRIVLSCIVVVCFLCTPMHFCSRSLFSLECSRRIRCPSPPLPSLDGERWLNSQARLFLLLFFSPLLLLLLFFHFLLLSFLPLSWLCLVFERGGYYSYVLCAVLGLFLFLLSFWLCLNAASSSFLCVYVLCMCCVCGVHVRRQGGDSRVGQRRVQVRAAHLLLLRVPCSSPQLRFENFRSAFCVFSGGIRLVCFPSFLPPENNNNTQTISPILVFRIESHFLS